MTIATKLVVARVMMQTPASGAYRKKAGVEFPLGRSVSRVFAFIFGLVGPIPRRRMKGRQSLPAALRTRIYALVSTWAMGFYLVTPTPALADCGQDLQKLAQVRNAELEKINAFAKAAKGKPLDPEQFCVRSVPLLHAEQAIIDYMIKNKEWCSIPDDTISNLKASHVKNAGFNAKACSVAAKIKKMKEEAAQGGGGGAPAQPLPAGPL